MVPLKTTLTPAHLCSCSGTSSRVRDPACRMYLHDTPVHACHCSACLSTEHLPPQAPPAPDRPLSADEDAALGSPYSAHFRPHLFPSAPSHPVSTQASLTPLRSESSPGSLPPARGSPSFSATASRALPLSLVPISRLSHAGEKGDGFPFADRMPFLYFLTPDTSDKSSISTSESLTHLKVLAPVLTLLLKVTH